MKEGGLVAMIGILREEWMNSCLLKVFTKIVFINIYFTNLFFKYRIVCIVQ